MRFHLSPRRIIPALLLFVLAGCGGGDGGPESSFTGNDSAILSVYHYLVTNGATTPNIASTVNDAPLNSDTVYLGGVTNRAVAWNPSAPDLRFRFIPNNTSALVFFDGTRRLLTGSANTGFLVGETNPSTVGRGADLVILRRDSAAPGLGKVRVRFFHAIPSLGPVDIYVGPLGVEEKVAENISFKEATDYVTVDAPQGNEIQMVLVAPAGSTPSTDPTANLRTPYDAFFWRDGGTYTVAFAHQTSDTSSRFRQVNLAE